MTAYKSTSLSIFIAAITICSLLATSADASLLYHAAKRGVSKRIAIRGFSKSAMNPNARFGPGAYFGSSAKTALSERSKAGSIAVFHKGKSFNKKVLDTRRLPYKKLEHLARLRDGRGTVKNGIVGPKLGHRLGNYASNNNKIIAYNSAKAPGGTNYFIPKNVYHSNGRLIRSTRAIDIMK